MQIPSTQTDVQLPFSACLYVTVAEDFSFPQRWLHVQCTSYLHVRLIYGPADCRTMELENPVELKLLFLLQLHLKVQCYKVYMIKICNKKLYVTTKITLILVTNIILFLAET